MGEVSHEITVAPEVTKKIPEALVVLGIGGNLQLRGVDRDQPVIYEQTMRRNAIAAAELDHLLAPHAVIIPTGKGTELTAWHYQVLEERKRHVGATPGEIAQKKDLGFIDSIHFIGSPQNENELTETAQVSQAELMEDLIRKVRTKYDQVSEQKSAAETHDVIPEKLARNTILNLIEALNILDEKASGVWSGKMIILSTNNGHLQRTEEIARALDLDGYQMLSSEQVLLHAGYGKKTDPSAVAHLSEIDENSARENEKNLRGTREIPEFFLPELVSIKSDERLKRTLSHLATNYYREYPAAVKRALESFDITDYENLTAEEIRRRIGQVGLDRTQLAYDLLTDDQKKELGLDEVVDLEQIRLVLASGVKPAEMVAASIKEKHGEDTDFLKKNGLDDIIDAEWWRVKNWFFGRILPPSDWGNTAEVNSWNNQNDTYNEMTEKFLQGREQIRGIHS